MSDRVVFLNPHTCGIYKNGATRFKTDPTTGIRTTEVDNQLIEQVTEFLAGKQPGGSARIDLSEVYGRQVLVPTYYDQRLNEGIGTLLTKEGLGGITLGELVDSGTISIRGGHGSPPNDQRSGTIPYVKVSDIRGLRVNTNPTNLVTEIVAKRFWRGPGSGLEAWDLITPNRASSNIGEFAVLLPGEEQIVLTKEVFILRVENRLPLDPFYLLWALSLKAVRDQWRRIALMQTNREDCGLRYREVILPKPPDRAWADETSKTFRTYFQTIADARTAFMAGVSASQFEHVANVASALPISSEGDDSEGDEKPAV